MRTTKELLQILLKEGNLNFQKGNPDNDLYEDGYKGLCGFTGDLRDLHIIDFRERNTLLQFIEHHKPKFLEGYKRYYWPRGEWKPRQRWLKYHINKIK